MLRAIVIGSPGAGKSTFARKLRDLTGLPLFYLDRIWHKPDKTNITKEEFDARLREILKEDRWIIDFSRDKLPQIYDLIRTYREDKEVIIFKSRGEADDYLRMITNR